MKSRIFLSSPHLGGKELEFINEAVSANWIAPLGPHVDEFERQVCALTGARHAVALNSGTSAIHLALKLAGVKEGDEVACSTFTFAASCNPILYERARPVFVDSEASSWNMSPACLERALKGRRPKAIVVADLYGQSADYDALAAVAGDIPIIEDSAESMGAKYKGKNCGTLGDYGVFSFNGNKIITTSGGGMLLTDSEGEAQKARFWATQSRDPAPWYQHSEIGYNYRMSNVCAAIGLGQLCVLGERAEKKRYIYEAYKSALAGYAHLMPMAVYGRSNCWLSVMTSSVAPEKIINALASDNIEARRAWKPMHLQPLYAGFEYFGKGVSDDIFNRGVCLPSDTKMTQEDIGRVAQIVRSCF